MVKGVVRLVAVVAIVMIVLGAVFMVGMRSKSPVVLGAVRRTNRAVFNPQQMKSAGTPGAYAAIIRHTGRTSGTTYETPVGALAADDGFLITLPYADQADWLKNVLASGSATLVHDGETHAVERPEVVAIDTVAHHFSPKDLRNARLFAIDQVLRLRRVDAATPT